MERDAVSDLDSCTSSWLDAVSAYITETRATSLNLSDRSISVENLKLLLMNPPGSQLKELILRSNCTLRSGMKDFCKVLVDSDVEKLDLVGCGLAKSDFFHLMEVLLCTKIKELDVRSNSYDGMTIDERDKCISLLLESHLKVFHFDVDAFAEVDIKPLMEAAGTKMTELRFAKDRITSISTTFYHNAISLFHSLPCTSLTHLRLRGVEFNAQSMTTFSEALKNSELRDLYFRCNLDDFLVNILVEGLVHSKVTDLDLSFNNIYGLNSLGLCLPGTRIQVLNLECNPLRQAAIFLSPDFFQLSSLTELNIRNCGVGDELFKKLARCLQFSKVTNLYACNNNLQFAGISELAEILKDTILEHVELASNILSHEALVALAEGIKVSKLKSICLSGCLNLNEKTLCPLISSEILVSRLDSLELGFPFNSNYFNAKALAALLDRTTLTRFSLSVFCGAADPFSSVAECLKYSALSDLYLNFCKITDKGVTSLAENLKETQIINLELVRNEITSQGAKALASALKDLNLLRLDLRGNRIGSDGIKALAEGAENTFLREILVERMSDDTSNNFLLLNAAIWRNRILVYRFADFFKQIAPQFGKTNFCFTENSCESDPVENYLEFYMNFIYKSAVAFEILTEDKSIVFSREELVQLMTVEFPKQFGFFVANSVEADVETHVNFLKKTDDLKLPEIVENLLLNRPLYLIDTDNCILHPYVYKLLKKYNHPIYNLDIDRDGKMKIIRYFTEHEDIDGAADVINLLNSE